MFLNKKIMIIVCFIVMIVLMKYFLPEHGVVVYNCDIAEISPDVPIAVKEECRKRLKDNSI